MVLEAGEWNDGGLLDSNIHLNRLCSVWRRVGANSLPVALARTTLLGTLGVKVRVLVHIAQALFARTVPRRAR